MPNLILPHCDNLPAFDSDFFNSLANNLWDRFMTCRDSRRGLESRWFQCDESYFAKRVLPKAGSIDWVIDSDMGETDMHDIVNLIAIRLTQAAMPRNRQWLKVVSRKFEAQELTLALQDQQLYLHELAQTRRNMKRFIVQQIIRGSSPVYVSWQNRYRLRRMGRAETRRKAAELFTTAGMDPREAKKLQRARFRELSYSAPRVEVIDNYDVFIEPYADILNEPRPFTIVQRFRRLSELFAELDDEDKPVYSNMGSVSDPEIVPFDASEIWNNRDFAYGRAATQEILGINPTRLPSGEKVVPVYIFFCPYLEWEGEEFWDCYFYLARSKSGRGCRIIRYEENDSDMGWNRLIMDNYTDWITPGNMGISPVWMGLAKWDQINVLEALTVQSAFATVHPAYLVNNDAFINPNEITFGPGGINPIDGSIDPKLAIMAVPAPANGLNLGIECTRAWREKLRGQMNVDGMAATNPSNTAQSRRTATEINQNSTAGSIFLDNQADQLTSVLTRVCQIVYDDSRQNLRPDPFGYITYDKWVQQNVMRTRMEMEMKYADLDLERSVTVGGFMGVMNEDQELQQLMQALEISGPLLPMAPQIVLPFVGTAYERLMAHLHIDPQQGIGAPGMPQGAMQPPGMPGQQPQQGMQQQGMPPAQGIGMPGPMMPPGLQPQGGPNVRPIR